MKLFFKYIYQYRYSTIILLIFLIIFSAVFFLYDTKIEAVIYAGSICALIAFIIIILNFLNFRKKTFAF